MARTDNDSWDLASSVGATATMVAAQRVLADREGLIDDPFAEPLVRAVGLDFFVRALDGEINLEEVDPRFSLQRAAQGMAVRTRHFDRLFTDAAADGVRQAVILAAGLDARAYRLPWPDGTTVFEVDQPEVIDFKTKTLTDLGATPRRSAARSPSIFVKTGRKHCWTMGSIPGNRHRGRPRVCSFICRRRLRTCCSTGLTSSVRRAAGSLPSTSPMSACSPTSGHS